VKEKFDIVNSLKVEVKRDYIDLEDVTTYFEALEFAINSSDSSLHSVGFSCLCHLVKRVITQDPNSLRYPANIALPMIIDKLGDQKSSVRDTTRKAFKDYWCASPAEVEQSMRNVGLCHPNSLVRSECLQLLLDHVQMQESKFTFRPFTPRVTALLNDTDETVSNLSQNLLVAFFKHAHVKAKQDLHRELTKQGVSKKLAARILKEVDFDPTAHVVSKPATNTSAASHEEHMPTGNISLDFLTEQPGYAMEETIKPVDYDSEDRFREDMEDLMPPFEGKESEYNWSQREKNITRLRGVLRGNVPEDFREDAIWMLKTLSDGVVKSITSLRTQLSNNGCQLIKDCALTLGTSMDPVIEPYLTNLVRMTNSAKKITHQTAAMSISVMIANTSYSGRYLNQINIVMSEKVAQSKIYCATWIKILICRHHRHKSLIENNGGLQTIEKNLQRGLSDANPGVREAMRSTFWTYYEVWPKEGEK
jgi:CLIP-associating protein 1/2